ncbi:MAG: flagellar biosynthetic protein FliR [Burkholderiaceae bacterium]|nr:flagellar biosynthetic protein FliR [Burkholderiaceae bacterium]MDH3459905.1 flagellar biosynthetic protein FliR [Burkholderiaceae bacterium]
MLTFSEAQVMAWINPLLWPAIRVLALFMTMPVLSRRNVPLRLRIALAFLIVLCAQSSLPEVPVIALDSAQGFLTVVQQLLIGISMGFAARMVFAAVEYAGELIGLQMGLSYAGFFDPATGGQTNAVSRFFEITVSWLFIVINGHLLMVAAVVQSFHAFPVGPEPFAFLREMQPQLWGAEIFRLGLWIALPVIAMLLFVNLILGIVSRVAQQMNVFAIGFPITVSTGLLGILFTLPMMSVPFTVALEQMLEAFQ